MPCNTCTDAARCDRAGLCQDVAKQQIPPRERFGPFTKPCPRCKGRGWITTGQKCFECVSGRVKAEVAGG